MANIARTGLPVDLEQLFGHGFECSLAEAARGVERIAAVFQR